LCGNSILTRAVGYPPFPKQPEIFSGCFFLNQIRRFDYDFYEEQTQTASSYRSGRLSDAGCRPAAGGQTDVRQRSGGIRQQMRGRMGSAGCQNMKKPLSCKSGFFIGENWVITL
jgi:hypothetical protein